MLTARIRTTQQKQAIKDTFNKVARPLTVQEVLAMAQDLCPGLGVATVYRAVNRLAKSLPTRFSFRRSSLEVDDVLDDHNNTKVSRGFRHSMGDIAAVESNEGSTNTA